MWTPTTREHYSRRGARYQTDMSDADWSHPQPAARVPHGESRLKTLTPRLDACLIRLLTAPRTTQHRSESYQRRVRLNQAAHSQQPE